jgi:uncharacterized membrane protein YhiD involved in acid resistance
LDPLKSLIGGELAPADLATAALHLVVALGCGLLLSTVYRRTYRGVSYSSTFDRSLITLCVITAIVIMVVGNNLARAFGLVGAMSIVRFRTALKDAQDLVFVFCSLAVGLASGVGLHLLALMGTVFLCIIIYLMARFNYGLLGHQEFVLQLSIAPPPGVDPQHVYAPVLDRYCRNYRLLAAKSTGADAAVNLTFFVELAKDGTLSDLTRSLGDVPEVTRANAFYDEEPA